MVLGGGFRNPTMLLHTFSDWRVKTSWDELLTTTGRGVVIAGLLRSEWVRQVEALNCYRQRLANIYSEEVLVVSEEVFASGTE